MSAELTFYFTFTNTAKTIASLHTIKAQGKDYSRSLHNQSITAKTQNSSKHQTISSSQLLSRQPGRLSAKQSPRLPCWLLSLLTARQPSTVLLLWSSSASAAGQLAFYSTQLVGLQCCLLASCSITSRSIFSTVLLYRWAVLLLCFPGLLHGFRFHGLYIK